MSNRIKIVLLIAFIGLVALAISAQAQSTFIQLGCSGQLIEPTAKTSSPKMLQLTISSEKVGVDFGSGSDAAKVQRDQARPVWDRSERQ
jgi:hypothetical protein